MKVCHSQYEWWWVQCNKMRTRGVREYKLVQRMVVQLRFICALCIAMLTHLRPLRLSFAPAHGCFAAGAWARLFVHGLARAYCGGPASVALIYTITRLVAPKWACAMRWLRMHPAAAILHHGWTWVFPWDGWSGVGMGWPPNVSGLLENAKIGSAAMHMVLVAHAGQNRPRVGKWQ